MLRVTTAMFLAAVVSAPAAAQTTDAAHTQSLGAGAQWALPYSARDAPPGVQVSWRRWWSPYLGIGTDFRWWRNSTRTEVNFPTQQGPEGGVIRAQRGRDDRRISSYGLGVSALAKGSSGRLSYIVGAGPGLFVDRAVYEVHINEWNDVGSTTIRSVGVQMLGEVDVRARRHISVFAGLRFELRDVRFVQSGSGYPTAGVRFAF